MFAFEIPESVARVTVCPNWNLGAICITQGVADFLDARAHELYLDTSLKRHLAGDYGLVSQHPEDQARADGARQRGVHFKSIYDWSGQIVFIGTDPRRGVTVVCLAEED